MPTPRPLGVAPGFPWEPRHPEREQIKNNFVIKAVEFFEDHPNVPNLAAVLLDMFSKLFVHDKRPAGAPVADPPGVWKFAAVGDYGVATKMQEHIVQNIHRGNPELVVTTGDNVYPTGRWEDYARNFDPPQYMSSVAKRFPFMPSLGNHDLYMDDLRPYFGHFPHLKGNPYYTFIHKNAQFYALDGDQDLRPGSAQHAWLKKELAESKSKWKIVYLHYPMHSSKPMSEVKEIREAVEDLMAKYNVKLVIAGHEHTYERSKPIKGIVHIITGGGGQTAFGFTSAVPDKTAYRKKEYNHVEVSVGDDALVVRAIGEDGNVFDTSVIPLTGPAQAAAGAALNNHQRTKRKQQRRHVARTN